MSSDPEFEVSTTEGGARVIAVRGRLNMVSAPALTATVRRCLDAGRPHLVVDLSACEFVDSSGLGALVAALKAARVAGGDLRLAEAGEQVTLALQLTKLDKVLSPAATVADAVARF